MNEKLLIRKRLRSGCFLSKYGEKGSDVVGTRVDNTKLFIIKLYSVIYRLRR